MLYKVREKGKQNRYVKPLFQRAGVVKISKPDVITSGFLFVLKNRTNLCEKHCLLGEKAFFCGKFGIKTVENRYFRAF